MNNNLRSRRIRWLSLSCAVSIIIGCVVAWAIRSGIEIAPDDVRPHSETEFASSSKSGTIDKPPAPRNDYVGSAACAVCHPKIAESYRGHSMANSLWEAATAPVLEDYTNRNTFSPDGRHTYSVERTPKGVFHHERLADEEGQLLYDQSVRVDYALGSGHQGRSYLIDRGGLMFMSPITWYSHAERWDLSPQYKLPVHQRFERRIVAACLNCHAGHVNSVRGTDDRFGSPPFSELSIGCERCHGPGGEHSSMHRGGRGDRSLDPIVNPAKLEPAFREDVCTQCHLQGQGSYPRYGCDIGDFRPGQRLEETVIVFVTGTRTTVEGTTRAVSQVEQTQSSRCFEMSNGRFGCTSCHDPHSRPERSTRDSFYRQKCLSCHTNQSCGKPESERIAAEAGDSCIACHMPRLGANDVPHTSQTDHRILRQPTIHPAGSGAAGLPEFYDHSETRLPALAIDYARGLWLADRADKKKDRELANRAVKLLLPVVRELPNDSRLLNALATASLIDRRFDDAFGYTERSLSIEPEREQTLEMISFLLQNSGRLPDARRHLERLLELNPWRAGHWLWYARILGQQHDWKNVIVAARKAEELDPSAPQTYQLLSEAYRHLGDEKLSLLSNEKFEQLRHAKVVGSEHR